MNPQDQFNQLEAELEIISAHLETPPKDGQLSSLRFATRDLSRVVATLVKLSRMQTGISPRES
jgi:hypothetical protein